MEKSIESIWTQGFLNQGDLLAPKINKLYKQKSNLVIEKYKRTCRTDNIFLIPMALIFGAGFSYAGHIDIGIYGMVLIISLFFMNRKKLKTLDAVDLKTDCYKYLVNFRKGIKELMAYSSRLLIFGFPLVVLPTYWMFFRKMEMYHKFIAKVDTIYIVLFVVIIALVLSAFGFMALKFSAKVVYGNMIKKMDEMIADMEELRK